MPLLIVAAVAPIAQAILSGARAQISGVTRGPFERFFMRGLTAWLHLQQPLARLFGRIRYDLTPWRKRGVQGTALPVRRSLSLWSETWVAPSSRLAAVEKALRSSGASVVRGGDFDEWDLEVRDGVFAAVRVRMAAEEHGGGKQLVRFHAASVFSKEVIFLAIGLLGIGIGAAFAHAWIPSGAIAVVVGILCTRIFQDGAAAMWAVVGTLKRLGGKED
jgi:hypothetical protein